MAWPDFAAGRVAIAVRGQDLVTARDGETTVTARVDLTIVADPASGRILEAGDGGATLPEELVGASLRTGFSRHLATADPDGGARRTLAHSVLDDLPGAFLVSGYSLLRAGLLDGDPTAGRKRAAAQGDVCIGWGAGGPVHLALAEHGRNAVPTGPDAPAIEGGEAAGWHPLAPMAHGTVRRRRQIDVWPSRGGDLSVQSHFRDSYACDDPEMVMHEYLVEATVDADRRVATIQVDPLVLPWEACPGAAASATAVVGVELAEIGRLVRSRVTGPSTCTHLNSTLRSLADVQSLAAHL